MLRHPADRLPILFALTLTLLDFSLYFLVENIWLLAAYWLLMIFPKGKICAINHNHQHTMTFYSRYLNRLLEFFYALHTGVTTNLWVLHHVLGHHKNYMNQNLDESRWKKLNGQPMKELEYTLITTVTAYYRGYLVGKKHPKPQRDFIIYSLITFAILGLLTWHQPLAALFIFILPMITGLLLTSWATYAHHTGLESENPFESSYNNTHRGYNLFTFNLGYHTAHHYKQGLHWSQLPQLHQEIEENIPKHLYRNSWF